MDTMTGVVQSGQQSQAETLAKVMEASAQQQATFLRAMNEQRAIVCYVIGYDDGYAGQCTLLERASASATSLTALGSETFAPTGTNYVSMDALDDEMAALDDNPA